MADEIIPTAPTSVPSDAERDRALITGHPAQDEPAGTALSRTGRVKLGDREWELPEDAAQAVAARERELSDRLTQQGRELANLRKISQEWEATKQAIAGPKPAQAEDLNTLWFEDPAKAAAKIKAEVVGEIESRYRQEQALEKFWTGFYRSHADLQEDDWVVRAQFAERFQELADLPVADAQAKLADITRQKILGLTRKRSPSESARPSFVEPASGDRSPRPSRQDEPEGPASLSEVIRARAQARRKPAPSGARGA